MPVLFLKLMQFETTDLLSFEVAKMEPLADRGTLSQPTSKKFEQESEKKQYSWAKNNLIPGCSTDKWHATG